VQYRLPLEGEPPRQVEQHEGVTMSISTSTMAYVDEHGIAASSRPALASRYQPIVVTVDAFAAASAVALIFGLRLWADDGQAAGDGLHVPYYVLGPMLVLVWLGVGALRGVYDRNVLGLGVEEYRRIMNAGIQLLAIVAVLALLTRFELSRGAVVGAVPMIVLLVLLGRYTVRQVMHRAGKHGVVMRQVLAVGTEDGVRELAAHFSRSSYAGFGVTEVYIPSAPDGGRDAADLGESSNVHMILERLDATHASVIAVTDTAVLDPGELRTLAWRLTGSGVDLVVAPSITDLAGPRISVNPVAGLPLLYITEPELSGPRRVLKSAVERTTATLTLILLAPLFASIALLVKLTSRGPVFYRQERVGKDGTTFEMIKFRSMVVGAERSVDQLRSRNDHDGVLFKMKQDPRVTVVGRWLRRFSLDELPQLVHVVTGKMALVGPRPPLPDEVAAYEPMVHHRLLVKPGLTGLWQVSGRADLPWDEAVRLDLYYVENWSLALDAAIVLRTLLAVARGSGAY
jgi:exopolysaccharide biosynthesis polyprenyl glycosylphosphotransferase